jgi:hypothetical protein
VLQSGVFAKAPRLETFFRCICDRYLRGESDQIKECSIATEALGRPGDFDPKQDSIVRVEAHRLRRRLEEFIGEPVHRTPSEFASQMGNTGLSLSRPKFHR